MFSVLYANRPPTISVAARMITRTRCWRAAATIACMTKAGARRAASVARGGAIDEQRAACHHRLADAEAAAHLDEAVGGGTNLDRPGHHGLVVRPRHPDARL